MLNNDARIQTKASHHSLDQSISQMRDLMLSQYVDDGYWWYTLEANDTINAESIFLMHYLSIRDEALESSLCRWLLKNQNDDGSWSLFYGGPGDLSATVECYTALKMTGYKPDHPKMVLAKSFILTHGSITKIRVFSRIHLALFGLIDWKLCPKMPVALMQFPKWAPVNIYEFSSWARACIVPLLVIMDAKKTHIIQNFAIDELYQNSNPHQAQWRYEHEAGSVSFENLFVQVDKMLQLADQMKLKPLRQDSLKRCENYIREHLRQTEDIYPAMFYGCLALYSLNYPLEDADIQKALRGLNSFRVEMSHNILSETPQTRENETGDFALYQQCCISPVWDTAWAGVAMLESGVPPHDDRIKKSGKWLLEKQIIDVAGDWSVKNPGVAPGGWSFQFQNKYYPDVDDTIEVLTFLNRIDLPYYELKIPIQRGLDWLLSMQCKNGGFAAFDKDNDLKLLNKLIKKLF
jgi:squalene-hopene/tetraprenyl-beta-curcumene cyclase